MNQEKDNLEPSSGDQDDLSRSSEVAQGVDAVSDDSDNQSEDQPKEKAAGEMTLIEHLQELRVRLVRASIAIFAGFLACYAFAEELFDILMEPMVRVLHNSNFIYTYPPEAFFTYLKVSFVAGFFLVSPYIFYQMWLFVAPGLYESERKWLVPIAVVTAIFFTAGALFGYFIVFPFGFEFFASYSTEKIIFTPKLDEYLSFSLKLLFAFGIVFEMPLIILFLARLGLVTAKGLRKARKYAILIIFVVAAILTPPDVFTQTLMAGPMILLYEIGIFVAQVFGREKRKPVTDEEEDEAAETK